MTRAPAARVLIADANAQFAGIVGELLDDEPGFTVVACATSGIQAVEAARLAHPDVVLVDERLDDRLSPEVLRDLRAAAPSVVVLLWSHHALHTASTDVDGVIERGLTFRELVRAMRRALKPRTIDLTGSPQPNARTT